MEPPVTEGCAVPRCRRELGLVYLGRAVCWSCWRKFMAEDQPADALRRKLGIA